MPLPLRYISVNLFMTRSRAGWFSVSSWKSRRRTISKPSSAVAGRQVDSTREKVCFRRVKPPRPPRRRSRSGTPGGSPPPVSPARPSPPR